MAIEKLNTCKSSIKFLLTFYLIFIFMAITEMNNEITNHIGGCLFSNT